MAEPYLGEIRMVGFNFAPRGYAFCDGQILAIAQNQSLFSLIGTTYGGDARTSFALPDLRGRVPMHNGNPPGPDPDRGNGTVGGEESHALTANELPAHSHRLPASGDQATATDPAGNAQAGRAFLSKQAYSTAGPNNAMRSGMIESTGSGIAHNNMQPFLAINYVIALTGLFPSRN